MAENHSNLVEIYKASPFADIGKKMTNLADRTIPKSGEIVDMDETEKQWEKLRQSSKLVDLQKARMELANSPTAKLNPFNIVNIDKVQSDFIEIVVKPFGTLLELNSQYGNIFIKPYESLSRFFDKINEPKRIELGDESALINKEFQKFDAMPYKSLIKFDSQFGKLSTVNFIPDMVNTGFTANAYKGLTEFFEEKIPGINPMPDTPDKNISKIAPMLATGVKPIDETVIMPDTPEKSISKTIAMSGTPNKPFASLRAMPGTSDKNVAELIEMGATLSKLGQAADAKYIPLIQQKIPGAVESGRILPIDETPAKEAGKTAPLDKTPEKQEGKLGIVNYIPDDYQSNFVINQELGKTQYKIDAVMGIRDALVVRESGFKTMVGDKYLPSFTTKDSGADIGKTEYTEADMPGFDNYMINITPYGFDFKNRIGVINQFDQYAHNYLDIREGDILTPGGYARILAKKIMYKTPGAINFFTPKVPVNGDLTGNRDYPPETMPYMYWGYSDPADVAENSSPLLERLVNLGLALTSQFAGSTVLNLIQQITGVDNSPLKISPLGAHVVAGNLYYAIGGFKGMLDSYKQSSGTNTSSDIFPEFITDAIGAVTGVVRGVQQAATILGVSLVPPGELVSSDYAELGLMMSQILAGTKYTAAYAFYDPTVKQYSSRWAVTGDNAVNLYYNDNSRIDEIKDGGKYSATRDWMFTSNEAGDKIDNAFKLSIYSRYTAIDTSTQQGTTSAISKFISDATSVASTIQGVISNVANVINSGVWNLLSQGSNVTRKEGDTILGKGFSELINKNYLQLTNPMMLVEDSYTFGTYKVRIDSGRLYEYWIPIHSIDKSVNTFSPSSILSEFGITTVTDEVGAISPVINHRYSTDFAKNDGIPAMEEMPITMTPLIKNNVPSQLQNLKNLPPSPVRLNAGQIEQSIQNTTDFIKDGGNVVSTAANQLGIQLNSPTSKNDFKSLYSDKLRAVTDLAGKKMLQDRGMPTEAGSNGGNYIDSKNAASLQMLLPKNGKAQEYDDPDLIDFYFEDVTSTGSSTSTILIPFRAIITNYSDSTNAEWQTNSYIGRPDKFYIYGGFDRKVSISFDVAINSKIEFKPLWQKLNYLQGMCYPTAYPEKVTMRAPILAVTVGNLLNRVYVVMNNINFNFDQSTLWEIEKGYQLPLYIKVVTDFNVLYDSMPFARANHFAQNQTWILPLINDPERNSIVSNTRQSLKIPNAIAG